MTLGRYSYALALVVSLTACGDRDASTAVIRGEAGQAKASAPSTTTIVGQGSGKCADLAAFTSAVGAGVAQWTCNGGANQSFLFTPYADGTFTIAPSHDGLCLDNGGSSVTSALTVVQATCNGSLSQRWRPVAKGSAYMLTTSDGSGCIDVYAGRTDDGAPLTTYACHGNDNQLFSMSSFSPAISDGPAQGDVVTPTASTDAAAPRLFNVSLSAKAGDVVSLQGAGFDGARVMLAGRTLAEATPLTVENAFGNVALAVRVPSSTTGAIVIWVETSHGSSNAMALNRATPLHLDALTVVPGGAVRIFGRSLFLQGITPIVRFGGLSATVDSSHSDENALVVNAPPDLPPEGNVTVTVDNGNGSGAGTLERSIAVAAGSGDPFGLGVGWSGTLGFAGRFVDSNAPCNGASDAAPAIQNAIDTAASAGGVVRIPAGVCLLMGGLTMRSNVVLQGAGATATELRYATNYAIAADGISGAGLRDLAIVNGGATQEGPLWKNTARTFFQRISINTKTSRQMFLTNNRDFVVAESAFVQEGTLNYNNPYLFNESSGFVFRDNRTIAVDGSPTFERVHDAVLENNHFTRDARNQNESTVVATHQLVIGFSHRMTLQRNTFDVINGPVTNRTRNDGETILTEAGGASRTENIGTVQSATATSIRDASVTHNTNPFGTGLPENYGLAIVSGRGAGQTRRVTSYTDATLVVDRAWDVIPDSTSHYATFVWGLEKTIMRGNTLVDNPRGIWIYQSAIRELEIVGNTIRNGGGIYLRSQQSLSDHQFDPIYGVRIADNTVRNEAGLWMSYLAVLFVNRDAEPFGTGTLCIDVRNNSLTANSPNIGSGSEEYAGQEGFMNTMRSEAGGGVITSTPLLLGSIFHNNTCVGCDQPWIIGTGADGTTLIGNQPSLVGTNALADWQTLGGSQGASRGTIVE